eukprot:Selendium_serpulae@DN5880_c0_g1_i3.p1
MSVSQTGVPPRRWLNRHRDCSLVRTPRLCLVPVLNAPHSNARDPYHGAAASGAHHTNDAAWVGGHSSSTKTVQRTAAPSLSAVPFTSAASDATTRTSGWSTAVSGAGTKVSRPRRSTTVPPAERRPSLKSIHKIESGDLKMEYTRQLIKEVHECVSQCRTTLHAEFTIFTQMAAAKQEATESVTALHAALSTCEAFKQQREDESKEKAKLIALLTAKDILNAGKEDLERGAEMLSAGLHETTIACSRCQRQPQTCVDPGPYGGAHTSQRPFTDIANEAILSEPTIEFLSDSLPPPEFAAISIPRAKENAGKTSTLIDAMIEKLRYIQAIQDHLASETDANNTIMQRCNAELDEKNEEYRKKLKELRIYENRLNTVQRRINDLSGKGAYAAMSPEQLNDLMRQITKAADRIDTYIQLRELEEATPADDDGDTQTEASFTPGNRKRDKEICMVCYEKKWNTVLSPCGHGLCNACATSLKKCPKCRVRIEGRQACWPKYSD